MNAPRRPWTDLSPEEKGDAVKPLILAGKSYAEIARALPIGNRNSVAGVVARLRRLGELPPAKSKKAIGKDGGQIVRARARLKQEAGLTATNIAVRRESRAEAPGIAINREVAFEPISGRPPVPFAKNFGCRWPVDGINGPGLLSCGASKEPEHVYCAEHRVLAYCKPHPFEKAAQKAAERLP